MKYCPRCDKEKPLDDFYDSPNRGDGKRGYCKSCSSTISRSNSRYHREYYRKRYRTDEKFRERRITISEEYRKRYKNRDSAKSKVRYALKIGVIKKGNCIVCGNSKTHAHHTDYSKPLDVIWLCPKHHKQTHIDTTK